MREGFWMLNYCYRSVRPVLNLPAACSEVLMVATFTLLASGFVSLAHAGGDPTIADLLYDPTTGDVLLDHTEATGGFITNFVLQSDSNFNAPGVANFPYLGIFRSDLDTEISQSDPLTAGWDNASNPWNLGPILSSGFSIDQVSQLITRATYVGELGSGVQNFDILLFEAAELIGDMDFNNRIDFDDIGSFVIALNDAPAYEQLFGHPPVFHGDTDGNGIFDFDDIPGFVALLGGGNLASVAAPEPSTALLGILGLFAMLPIVRRRV